MAVRLIDSNICISTAYVPPNSRLDVLEEDISIICNMFVTKIFVGDFNWNVFNKVRFDGLKDLLMRNDLNLIHNDLPSHYDPFRESFSLLDYFMISNPDLLISSAQTWLPAVISKHAFICINVFTPVQTHEGDRLLSYRNLKLIDKEKLDEDISKIDFRGFYSTNDPNNQLAFINSSVLNLLNKHAPLKLISINSKNKFPFMNSREIVAAKEIRHLAYKAFYNEPVGEEKDRLRAIYVRHRNKVTKLIDKKKKEHGFKLFDNCSGKKAWSILRDNGLNNNQNSIPENISLNELNVHFTKCNSILIQLMMK